jgi:hypothetical protein
MEKVKIVFFVLMVALTGVLKAQEVEITDEELTRYAVVMDSIDVMKSNVKEVLSEMVASNEEITGTRYNELSKVIDNAEKLADVSATESEIAFVISVKEKGDELTKEINAAFQSLAINYIGDGGRVYKKVKSALKTDESVKERYVIIKDGLSENEAADVEDSKGTN